MAFQSALSLESLPPGSMRAVTVAGISVLVVREGIRSMLWIRAAAMWEVRSPRALCRAMSSPAHGMAPNGMPGTVVPSTVRTTSLP